jgi:hypothetical protein
MHADLCEQGLPGDRIECNAEVHLKYKLLMKGERPVNDLVDCMDYCRTTSFPANSHLKVAEEGGGQRNGNGCHAFGHDAANGFTTNNGTETT